MKGKDELILDAVVQFEGVWPDYYEGLIVSTESNDFWGEGVYQDLKSGSDDFRALMDGCSYWRWVGTKEEFELRVKEVYGGAKNGESHVAIKTSGDISLVYFSLTEDSDTCFYGYNSDGISCKFSKTFYGFFKLPEQDFRSLDDEKDDWNGEGLPPVGEKIQYATTEYQEEKPSIEVGKWYCGTVIAYHDGFVWTSDNGLRMLRVTKFRPLKTETEKERELLTQKVIDCLNEDRDIYYSTGTSTLERIAGKLIDCGLLKGLVNE